MDRSHSIASDSRMDDPREFAVYLAHHGGRVKVGITAVERGQTRLLEQGALTSVIISSGTLASARRVEKLFTSALGLTDRMSSSAKRAARTTPRGSAERADDLRAILVRAGEVDWPEGQARRDIEVNDHTSTYGLPEAGLHPLAALAPVDPGCVIAGQVACHIGTDLYLDTGQGLVLIDTRLLAGWALDRAHHTAVFAAPVKPIDPPAREQPQEALF